MSKINEKQPATVANLTKDLPVAIKYNRDLIKKIALTVIVVLIGSLFVVASKKDKIVVESEEQPVFEHITPKIYNKEYQYNVQQQTATENADASVATPAVYYRKTSNSQLPADNEKVASEHNMGLLKEYFEQQALIKIKEEDDARLSPMAFAIKLGNDNNLNVQGKEGAFNNGEVYSATATSSSKSLKAGSIIPCVLSTAINSDLPGMVIARVRENIFDTATGKFLLIPQGSTLVGNYDNKVQFGQDRVQIVFNRIDLPPCGASPNGKTIDLDNVSSSDLSGHAGMSDSVNNHYARVAIGVTLSSLLMAMGKDPRDEVYYRDRLINKASENISSIANKIADKQMNQSPTITIRGGLPFNVMLAKDLNLQPI